MIEHPDISIFESFVVGGLERVDDEAFVAHVRSCEACAERLAREARLAHVLLELPSFRGRGTSHSHARRTMLRFGVPLATVAAAALLFVVRRSSEGDIHGDPSVTQTTIARPAVGVGDPPIADADAVVASLRPQFRRCYQDGLSVDPKLSGKVVIVASVGPNGEVTSASVGSSEGLSPGVIACLVEVVRHARFAGNGTGSTLHIPVSFAQTNR